MSIAYPSNNATPSRDGAGTPPAADAPIKPFRAPVAIKKSVSFDPAVIRAIYDDNKELNQVLLYGLLAVCIIAGSIIAKTGFTYATLALMFIAIFGYALVDSWRAIFLFIIYLSLEGMYKYTSNFSPAVYIIAPLLSIIIFIGWRIRSRGEAEQLQSKTVTPVKPSLFQSGRDDSLALPKIAPWVFALIALSLLQTANPDSPGFINSLNGGVVWYIGPMSFFFVTFFALKHRKEAMGFVYTMLVTGVLVSGYAFLQFTLGEAWVDSHVPGMANMAKFSYGLDGGGGVYQEGAYRPASTAAIAGGYVVATCMAMLAALTVATMPQMVMWRRALALLATTVLVMGLAVSGVRQVVLNLCVGIPVLLALSVRRFEDAIRIYFMMFLIGGILGGSFMTADNAAEGKLSKRFGSVFTGNPLDNYAQNRGGSLEYMPKAIATRPLGIGIRRGTRGNAGGILGGDLLIFNNRETQWNAVQADLGIFGIICLAGYMITALVQGLHICRTLPDPNLRSIAILMYVVILFNVIASFGSTVLQSNYMFWMVSGILFALPRIAVSERKLLMESLSKNDSGSDSPGLVRA